MRQALHFAISLAVTLLTQSACTSEDGSAFERWKANEPDQYVVQTCTMGIEPPGCVRALVEEGEVVSIAERIYAGGTSSWEDFTEEHAGADSPLDAIFAQVAAGGDDGCAIEDVRYESQLHYIESYALRCDDSLEGGRWVACFESNTADVEACDVIP